MFVVHFGSPSLLFLYYFLRYLPTILSLMGAGIFWGIGCGLCAQQYVRMIAISLRLSVLFCAESVRLCGRVISMFNGFVMVW